MAEIQYTDEDMANVGRAFMTAIREFMPEGWSPMDCPSEAIGDLCCIIDDLKAELASHPQWMPVSELPTKEGLYLGMLREDNPLGWTWAQPVEVAFGMLLHDRKRFSVFDPWENNNVDIQDYMTHWMPLPAAPENAV